MKYLFAIFIPPLAVLLCGRPFLAIINAVLWACCWFPGSIHALLVVSDYEADRRTRALVRAMRNPSTVVATQVITQVVVHVPPPPQPLFLEPPPPKPIRVPSAPRKSFSERLADARALATRLGSLIQSLVIYLVQWSIWSYHWAIASYRNLPEWAQPIVWGMAAATPVVFAIAIIRVARH